MILTVYKTENHLKILKIFWGFLKGAFFVLPFPICFHFIAFQILPECIENSCSFTVCQMIVSKIFSEVGNVQYRSGG